jgi:hypothetical protein
MRVFERKKWNFWEEIEFLKKNANFRGNGGVFEEK